MHNPTAAAAPGQPPLRVLHLEDDPLDAELLREVLESGGLACDFVHADRRERFVTALSDSRFDVVVCDYNMPGFDGLTALKLARSQSPSTPVVIVSGAINPDEAVACLRAGAADYILKERMERLPSALSRAVEEARHQHERRELELQLQHAQKMESVGRLAGGIAHDFNNVLTVINAVAELAQQSLAADDPLRADLDEIRMAGEHAAALTRQLLAFSRKQVLQPKVLNLTTIVRNTESMLRRLIGEEIELVVRHDDEPLIIRADAGQLEQVIFNLVVNARDAMPEGGTLTLESRVAEFQTPRTTVSAVLAPGRYVVLSVTDTGVGMDDETMERAFEPFYTTKGPEKGTGLGLSTVHGIVAQSGGGISVTSTAGRGTTFEVFLPQLSAAEDSRSTSGFPTFKRGTETILVAEDNGALRRLACRILRSAGYTVREAATGEEALELLASLPGQVHLLLTDVVMPRINGGALARRCQELRPMTRILFMSGHTDDALVLKGIFESDLAFVGKPYTAAELTAKVREVLDA